MLLPRTKGTLPRDSVKDLKDGITLDHQRRPKLIILAPTSKHFQGWAGRDKKDDDFRTKKGTRPDIVGFDHGGTQLPNETCGQLLETGYSSQQTASKKRGTSVLHPQGTESHQQPVSRKARSLQTPGSPPSGTCVDFRPEKLPGNKCVLCKHHVYVNLLRQPRKTNSLSEKHSQPQLEDR